MIKECGMRIDSGNPITRRKPVRMPLCTPTNIIKTELGSKPVHGGWKLATKVLKYCTASNLWYRPRCLARERFKLVFDRYPCRISLKTSSVLIRLFSVVFNSSKQMTKYYFKLIHDHFLQHLLKFIILIITFDYLQSEALTISSNNPKLK
jgi:hypothetical protein